MEFIDWFDINSVEHAKAYMHLANTGSWPENFIPDTVGFNPLDLLSVDQRLAIIHMETVISAND